jgi:hypothetical protein
LIYRLWTRVLQEARLKFFLVLISCPLIIRIVYAVALLNILYSTPFFGISDYELVCYPVSKNRVRFKRYEIKEISYEWTHTGIILEIHNHKGFVHNICLDETKQDIENLIEFIKTYTCFSPKAFSYSS